MIIRRLVPPFVALVVFVAMLVPAYGGWPGEATANRWTLLLLTVAFGWKGIIFAWMRHRMHPRDDTGLTMFGTALWDWLGALVLLALALMVFFGLFWLSAVRRDPLSRWEVTVLRAVLAATAALAAMAGIGVAWEMGARTGPRMMVHLPPDGEDVALYSGPERRGSRRGRRTTDRG